MKGSSSHMSHSTQRIHQGTNRTKPDKQQHQRISQSFMKSFIAKIKKVFCISNEHSIHISIDAKPEASSSRPSKPSCNSSKQNSAGSYWSSWRTQSSDLYGSSCTESGPLGSGNFTFEEIYKATNHFCDVNILGQGGFGTVYKGRLKDGSLVAIKRFKKNDKHITMEFKNEIFALSKIEHLNLVRLYGYMEQKDEQVIVVEYVGNGTLRDHLDNTRGHGLDIAERLDIAVDVAHAITYLHTYSDIPVIHRDIKSPNILITENFRAKVADFGFARVLTEDPYATHVSTQVKGTAGYLDPVYLGTYQLTEKSDVYSFGVLLVELITGRHPIENKRPEKERVTIKWALEILREGDIVLAMDPRIGRSPASIMAAKKVLRLGHQCIAHTRQSRPSMRKCAEVLCRIRKEYKEMDLTSSRESAMPHISESCHEEGAKNSRKTLFGIEDDENLKFNSA